jgi:hypothetical protein
MRIRAVGVKAQTIDIDETVTLADQTVSDFQHVPETYAKTDLLEDLYASINFVFSSGVFLQPTRFEYFLLMLSSSA